MAGARNRHTFHGIHRPEPHQVSSAVGNSDWGLLTKLEVLGVVDDIHHLRRDCSRQLANGCVGLLLLSFPSLDSKHQFRNCCFARSPVGPLSRHRPGAEASRIKTIQCLHVRDVPLVRLGEVTCTVKG